jgi:tetratricopeptide (TPR) repeat protein
MKNLLLLAIVLCICGLMYAQGEVTPLNAYLKNPNVANFSKAVSALDQSISKGEKVYLSQLHLAYIADYEAKRLMDELITHADSLAAGERFTLANILLGQEEYEKAIGVYNSLNSEFPNWSCPWRHKGEAYYKIENYNESVKSLTEAIRTNEEHYDAYVWMAYALNKLERYPEALQNIEKAMTLSPEEEESDDEAIAEEEIQKLYQELKAKVK